MKISKQTVATIHYCLRNATGTIIDSSEGGTPLIYLHGAGNLIPGMEAGLEGQIKGNKFKIRISPEEGYGLKDDGLIQQVPRSSFPSQNLEPGMQFQTDKGMVVTITKVDSESVTVDGNHPLAGEFLDFDVEVMDVRNATAEEIAHGHVHGSGEQHSH